MQLVWEKLYSTSRYVYYFTSILYVLEKYVSEVRKRLRLIENKDIGEQNIRILLLTPEREQKPLRAVEQLY